MSHVRTYGARARLPGNMMDLIVASLFINILSLALPITLLQVYDRILPNSAVSTLVLLVIGVGVALILETILRLARSVFSAWIGARFEHLTGTAAIRHMSRADGVVFDREGSGIHIERMGALSTLKDFYSGQSIITLLDIPFAVLFIGVIYYLGGDLAYIPIGLIALFFILAQILGYRLRRAIAGRNDADERRISFIIEVLSGIQTIKSMAMEAQILRRYERLQEGCAQHSNDVTQRSASAMNLGSFFSQLTMFMVVAFGALKVIDGSFTVGSLAACTILAGRAMQPLQRAAGMWARFQNVRLAGDKVQRIFDMPVHQPDGLPAMGEIKGEIELREIGFRYGPDSDWLLRNVSLNIKTGEMIGIAGGNIGGKTELLLIILGALKPTEGQILIDGMALDQVDVTSLQGQVAYLPQNPVLFKGTILENLTLFRPELENAARVAARLLDLEGSIGSMSRGYETPVSDGSGDTLPRGIKQRIAIARALVSDPKVILFDEANAAMDSEGDRTLRGVMRDFKGKHTVVMITQRPSLLRLCDQVFELRDGTPHRIEVAAARNKPRPGQNGAAGANRKTERDDG